MDAFRSEILPAVRSFEPQILVTQLGADAHWTDPLASLRLTTAAWREAYRELHELAHELCEGRWMATGGGGYSLTAVPRGWTIAFGEMCGVLDELSPDLPAAYVAEAERLLDERIPRTLFDG